MDILASTDVIGIITVDELPLTALITVPEGNEYSGIIEVQNDS